MFANSFKIGADDNKENGIEVGNHFVFDNQTIFNQHIEPVFANFSVVIEDGNELLFFVSNPLTLEFYRQCFLVN